MLAGVGNLYADEICYRARLHPGTSVAKLSESDLKSVYAQLHDVMHYAVDNAPYYKEYPDDWFWHVWREEGKTGPEGYGEVKKTKVAGRTTYYVTEWQREP
jgi:formamidopyrimidine-DNA glycosylase